jgi:hypothetical protein
MSYLQKYWSLYTLILGIANLLFNLISEALFFKFATCFNFPSNAIVVARSSLAILLMILMLSVALFVLIHFLKHGKSRREKLGALLAPLLILPSIVMLVLNAILIAHPKRSFLKDLEKFLNKILSRNLVTFSTQL